MAQSVPYGSRRPSQTAQVDAAAGFKPVALPALAAALRKGRETQGRDAGERELPPILRKEAVLG